MTADNLTKKIVREYDRVFVQTKSRRQTRVAMRKVLYFERKLRELKVKEKEKELMKMLPKVKWVL